MLRDTIARPRIDKVHMKKLTATAAAIAAVLTSFAANAQPHTSKVSRSAQNVSVASAEGLPGVSSHQKVALNTTEQKASTKKTAKTSKKVHTSKKKTTKKTKKTARVAKQQRTKVVVNTKTGYPGIDGTKTSSIASLFGGAVKSDARFANVQYSQIVSRYASAYGVPVALAHAVIKVESNYRSNARGGAGEIGLMQIKPATARMMGYSGSAKGLFDPETNIKFGMKYLALAHSLGGGSTCGTILKYNAGHGAKRMNPVSAAYCSKVKQQLALN